MNWLLSSKPLSDKGTAFVRVIVGVLLIIHGTQVFYTNEMNDYGPWLSDLSVPFPEFSAYAGKIVELVGGVSRHRHVFENCLHYADGYISVYLNRDG